MIHQVWCMTRSKGKVTEVWNLRKWPISKAVSSANRHAIKRPTVNYDTTEQYLNFNRTDFWYLPSFGVTWPSNLGCSTFGKRILPATRSQPAVPHGNYCHICLSSCRSFSCFAPSVFLVQQPKPYLTPCSTPRSDNDSVWLQVVSNSITITCQSKLL